MVTVLMSVVLLRPPCDILEGWMRGWGKAKSFIVPLEENFTLSDRLLDKV